MLRRLITIALVALGCSLYGSLSAQTSTARISGIVSDDTGGVLPGVQVVVRNTETGFQRTIVSDQRGRYIAQELPPGSYEISASMTGFDVLLRRGITLVVGQEASIPLNMRVGAVTEQVTVTGDAPLMDATSSTVSGVVDERRITALPLNGRDFSQLALVQPGVVSIRNAETGSSKGFGTRISLTGSRPEQTGWLLDGTNIKSVGNFGTPGSASDVMMGVEAVREFRVLSGGYSAEYGGSSGGVVQLVTKSGTNELHGSIYEFLRNDNLDARKFFDTRKAEFRRNQFGAAVGGYIKQDKAFFFGNYEALRQARVGETLIDSVPDENVRRGLIPAPGGTLRPVNIAASVRPYLDQWPVPNGPPVGVNSGVAQRLTPVTKVTNEDFFVARLDYHLNSNQTLFGRITVDQGDDSSPAPLGVRNQAVHSYARYATIQHEYIISPRVLATSRVGYNRTNQGEDPVANIDYPRNLHFLNNPYPPDMSYPGITGCCGGARKFNRAQNIYEFSESMLVSMGSHSLKVGGNVQRVGGNLSGPTAAASGAFRWATLEDFLLDNRLQSFEVQVPGSGTDRSLRNVITGFYVQDDWQLRTGLTLNLGLRYEPFTAPSEKWGRMSTIRDYVTASNYDIGGTMWNNQSKKNFSPRAGVAWAPTSDGRTAVRAGFGLFYGIPTIAYVNTIARRNPPYNASITTVQGNLASAAADVQRVGPSLLMTRISPNAFSEIAEWDMNSTYEMKFNLAVERELIPNLSLSVGYAGTRGVHLWRISDANGAPAITVNNRPFVVAQTPRLNPNVGPIGLRHSDAQSFYNSMTVEVKKRFSEGLQFQSSYTWAKNVDDGTTGFANSDYKESGATSQAYNTKADRGLSSLHLAHNFVLNGLWSLPSPSSTGISSYLFGGWQISGIYSASTGAPLEGRLQGRNAPDLSVNANRQRPDLHLGRNNSNIKSGTTAGCTFGATSVAPGQRLGTTELYFDPCAFYLPPAGFYGNAGRNIFTGPSFSNVDFGVLKTLQVGTGETKKIEFHADFFNLFNRAYLGFPNLSVLNPTNGQLVAGVGKITSTVGDARQVQLGLKFIF